MPIDPARTIVILRSVSEAICTAEGWRDIQALQDQITEAVADLSGSDEPDEVERLRETLAWYGEQARLCRLIHSEGDAGRDALAQDGGKRARAALALQEKANA